VAYPLFVGAVFRTFLCACLVAVMPISAISAPYAAMVVDARTGKVLHSRNADTRLHPASLTKMMTLYVVFDAIEKGEIGLDSKILISRKAAAEQPSKLGLKAGSRIQLRYLIRAAAVKSANDAATALGEAISGSEAAFARRMTRTARAMGMSRTTFKNAHGLTESGHLSTARDMTVLGRHLFYDFPEYYNLFSRKSTSAGIKTVNNTNRRLLGAYRGADGIKTGYTRAAGFNLVASAERGSERIIATVFGGRSTAWRNARVAELLDMGFERAPSRVAVRKPSRPVLTAEGATGTPGRVIRTSGLVTKTSRPRLRPVEAPPEEMLIALQDGVENALAQVVAADASTANLAQRTAAEVASKPVQTASLAGSLVVTPRPRARILNAFAPTARAPDNEIDDQIVVTRMSTSGGRQWAINVGRFSTRYEAEKMLLQTALVELGTLDEALRKVVRGQQGFEANFVGLTAQTAELACRRLLAQNVNCRPMGPS